MFLIIFSQKIRQLTHGSLFAPLLAGILSRNTENGLSGSNGFVDSRSGQNDSPLTYHQILVDADASPKNHIIFDARNASNGGMASNPVRSLCLKCFKGQNTFSLYSPL